MLKMVIGLMLASSLAQAQTTVDIAKITCDELRASNTHKRSGCG